MLIGGYNQSVFFTANEETGTVGATPLITFSKKIKTSTSRTTVDIEQNEDNPALSTFIETYAPAKQVGATDSGEYEDGSAFDSATGDNQTLLHVNYGATDTTTGKRKVSVQLIKLAADVGAFDQESGKYTKPKISGTVVANKALMTIPTANFNAAIISAALTTIAAKAGYKETWPTAL